MNPATLDYPAAESTPRRRLWRRVRLPLLAVVLLAAVVATPFAWQRADQYLAERERARWAVHLDAVKAATDDMTRPNATPQQIQALRAAVARFESRLPAALAHKDRGVRKLAVGVVLMASMDFDHFVYGDARRTPLFTDETRAVLWDQALQHAKGGDALIWPLLKLALQTDARPIDLKPAIAAWPGLVPARQAELIELVHDIGPQNPDAGELLLLADATDDPRVRRSLEVLLTEWFSPIIFGQHAAAFSLGQWSMPPKREVMDPHAAVRAFGGDVVGDGAMSAWSLAVVAHFGPRAGDAGVDFLPALDAVAAQVGRVQHQRDRAAEAARAIRRANGLAP